MLVAWSQRILRQSWPWDLTGSSFIGTAEDAGASCQACQAVKTAKMFEALAAKVSLLSKSCTS